MVLCEAYIFKYCIVLKVDFPVIAGSIFMGQKNGIQKIYQYTTCTAIAKVFCFETPHPIGSSSLTSYLHVSLELFLFVTSLSLVISKLLGQVEIHVHAFHGSTHDY